VDAKPAILMDHENGVKATLSYFKLIEERLPDLIDIPNGTILTEDSIAVRHYLWRALQLSAAFRRYPVFDPSCLSAMKKITARTGSAEVDVWVPTFAWMQCDSNWLRSIEIHLPRLGGMGEGAMSARFSDEMSNQNDVALRGSRNESGNLRLTATPPVIPVDVKKKIAAARQMFGEIYMVWDAEWLPRPVGDPLIVGVIDKHCFLIEKFDATKVEHYVSSEYCRRSGE